MLIHEVARQANLSRDGIRHYEALGLIASTPRRAGSRTYRDYAPSVVDTIEKVRQAQRLGLSLREIGPILRAYASAPPDRETMVAFLEERLAIVRQKQADLAGVESVLRDKLARYGAGPQAR